MKVLYCVCTFGLGHATRSLPLIRRLVSEGNEVDVVSSGRSLGLIQKEMGEALRYHDIPDYSIPYPRGNRLVVARTFPRLPKFAVDMKLEHLKIVKLVDEGGHDVVISDNRYGGYAIGVPSYLLMHQLRFITPNRSAFWENRTERFNLYFQKKFERFLVPDLPEDSLSGDLSHNLKLLDASKIVYVGPLSDFKASDSKHDIDVLVSISGPEPHRTSFEERVLPQLDSVRGRVAVTLGRSELHGKAKGTKALVYHYLDRKEREALMNRAKLIVSRSGYSTLMDIALMGKRALFVPTPNQTEQEYLGRYHMERGRYLSVDEGKIDLQPDIERAMQYPGMTLSEGVDTSVKNALTVMGIG